MRAVRFLLSNPSLLIGGLVALVMVAIAILAPWITFYPPEQMDMANRFSGPSAAHWLGTDNFGRDLWTRMAYGARVSLGISFAAVICSAIIGSTIGFVAGYFGGIVDNILMRITDAFLALPVLLLALALIAALGTGVINIIVALCAVFWTEYARVVRATTLSIRNRAFVDAARIMGASHFYILRREILPNALGPIIVLATLGFGGALITESALGFLGFGVAPPTPSWGWTLAYGTQYLRDAPWLSTVAGLAIMLTVLGFNLLGDGLRDALDSRRTPKPRSTRRWWRRARP